MPAMICRTCGFRGYPITIKKGSNSTEILLWIFTFLIFGFLYSLWRLSTQQEVCPKCQQPGMVPADSPVGRELAEKYGAKRLSSQTERGDYEDPVEKWEKEQESRRRIESIKGKLNENTQ